MKKFEVETAVGYLHGAWELETTEIELGPGIVRHDIEQIIADAAEEKIEERLGYNKNDVSFYHLMYYSEIYGV